MLFLGYVAAYAFTAAVTFGVAYFTIDERDRYDRYGDWKGRIVLRFFLSVAWPVGLPIIAGFMIAETIVKGIKWH